MHKSYYENKVIKIMLITVLITMVLVVPYLGLFLFLLCASLYLMCSNEYNKKNNLLFLYSMLITLIISAVFICTKSLNPLMNDKLNYWIFMRDSYNQTLLDWALTFRNYDYFSYLLMKVSSSFFGVGNLAFLFFYTVSFSFLCLGIYRIIGYPALFCMVFFITQYNFEGLYGNLLRQSLGLSIFVYSISKFGYKRYLYFILSVLSHFSFFIFTPFIFFINKLIKLKTSTTLLIYVLSYFIGEIVFPKVMLMLSGINTFFLSRADSYDSDVFGNDIHRKMFVTLIFGVSTELLYLLKNKMVNRNLDKLQYIRGYITITISIFLLTISFVEVANRYSFNIMIFFLMYLSIYIYSIKNVQVKFTVLLLLSVFIAYFSIYINFVGVQFFYFNDLKSILTDNIFELLKKVLYE